MSVEQVKVRLEPLSVEVVVPRGVTLISSLAAHGLEFPCGGTGVCGGCGVCVLSGSLPVSDADRTAFSEAQLSDGWRLACQARAEMPLVLECGQWHMDMLADNSVSAGSGKHGLGIAIDLGTTTIAAQLIELASGRVLAVETALNPQARFGADVMSRVQAALSGSDLTAPVRSALGEILVKLVDGREQEVAEVILVGNTVMHHLFSGLGVEPLSHVPFASPYLGAQRFTAGELGWHLPAGCTIRFAQCLGGFVGSDILAGIIACGITNGDDLVALVDLGTNGEIAIGNRHGVVCASTAAGPAFEAGAIRMGMRAATGAVSQAQLRDGGMQVTVIGDVGPRGICGSGLVDAVAAGLSSGAILPSGRIADGTKLFRVTGPVVLYQADIRELQLAKAAIAAGFRLVLKRMNAHMCDLKRIHLAGAFGNYVRIASAIRIGLIESPDSLMHAAGNTALRGAKMLLAAREEPCLPRIDHLSLAAVPSFQDQFADCMTFPNDTSTSHNFESGPKDVPHILDEQGHLARRRWHE